ncbi:MAG TPA: hypothetical protein VFB00_01640, partial [Terriglobales bacterium]|nr:hypothetical protein [Terriglobales bacterium]
MSNVATTSRELGNYLAAFTEFAKRAPGQKLGWLRKLREDAFARFCEVGFPTTHDEDWRFTNVSPIAQTAFQLPPVETKVSAEQIEPYRLAGAACQLVFVNGKFAAELSSASALPNGVSAGSLAQEIRRDPKPLEKHLGRYLNTQRDVFCALNTAFLEDGAYVHVGRGTVLEAPIYLLFVTTASAAPVMTHPRNLIIAEEDSQAAIVEDYVSL